MAEKKTEPVLNIRAPRGSRLLTKGWSQEGALRMLMNNLDPHVAEKPAELIVYGGTGRAARNWEAYRAIVAGLKTLENDETLIVQSGKPVAVFRTHAEAPRVLISNAMIVPRWADWDEFRRLEALGLTMYGQMTAGSWIYIGTQGILQGTYETLSAVGRKHFGGSLKGKLALTAGLGGMGGAQPLAVTMNDGVAIVVEVDPHRIERRLETKYVDIATDSLDEALRLAREALKKGEPLSIALLGNAADILPEFVRRGIVPDVLTDQTSAHDELNGYVPHGIPYGEALALRTKDPADYIRRRALWLPENARYDFILGQSKDQDPAALLNAAMKAIEESFEPLTNVLPKDYSIFTDRKVLEELLKIFNREALKTAGGDIFGRIYEYFLQEFSIAKAMDNGEFFTPPSIVQTIVNVIEPDHGTVADIACGSGGMFVQSDRFTALVQQHLARTVSEAAANGHAAVGADRPGESSRLSR